MKDGKKNITIEEYCKESNENFIKGLNGQIAALEAQLQAALARVKELEDINESIRNWNACEEQNYKNLLADNRSLLQELEALRGVQTTRFIETQMGPDSFAWECEICKDDWICTEGTPDENNFRYCPMCGAKVVEYVALDALAAVKGE